METTCSFRCMCFGWNGIQEHGGLGFSFAWCLLLRRMIHWFIMFKVVYSSWHAYSVFIHSSGFNIPPNQNKLSPEIANYRNRTYIRCQKFKKCLFWYCKLNPCRIRSIMFHFFKCFYRFLAFYKKASPIGWSSYLDTLTPYTILTAIKFAESKLKLCKAHMNSNIYIVYFYLFLSAYQHDQCDDV